jgi:hypothetical protein
MLKVRTQGDVFRRSMYIRVFTFALLLFVFVDAVLSGEEAGAIIFGILTTLQISILVFYFWLFRNADPSVFEAPIDPAVRMHWRYLRPTNTLTRDLPDQRSTRISRTNRPVKNELLVRVVTLVAA